MKTRDASLEPVEATPVRRTAVAETEVTAAWADHHQELYAFLVRTTRDADAAEDLLQEAFLRLTREVRAGRTPTNVRAWLYRVASNLAVSRGRRIATALRSLLRVRDSAGQSPAEEAPEPGYLARETRRELVEVLNGLSPDARAALLLSSEGFSGAEIAAAIGRSEPATRTFLCRTRVRVRRTLEVAEVAR